MQDEAIYRCSNAACARPAPRPVHFCPYCGTAQPLVAGRDAHARASASASAPPVVPVPPAAVREPTLAATPTPPPMPTPPPTPTPPPPPPPPPMPTPSATDFGRSGRPPGNAPPPPPSSSPPPPAAAPPESVPRPPIPAQPPQRAPIRLRWWILALAFLWGAWLLAKPSTRKIEKRIDEAVALARQCKSSQAQDELIALRSSRATPEQLERLQKSLNDEAAACTRRRLRARAWSDASAAAEAALASSAYEKANARLLAFTRRWGTDGQTLALQQRIDDARREDLARGGDGRGGDAPRAHPLAVPPDSSQLR